MTVRDPSVWPLDAIDTRVLVEELIATHEADGAPDLSDVASPPLALIVWPLAHQVFRFAKAALALLDAGLGHEAHVFMRTAIEYTLTAHYLTELGEAGPNTWVAAQSVQADLTINLSMATMPLDVKLRRTAESEALIVKEKTALDGFFDICRDLGMLHIYGWWSIESGFVHPTAVTENQYARASGTEVTLHATPLTEDRTEEDVLSAFGVLLLWASSTADGLLKEPRHERRLAEVAALVNRAVRLPKKSSTENQYSKRKHRKHGWKSSQE